MISIKKFTAVAAAAVLSFGLFAQTEPVSKTSVATAGLFGNDVDDFTNVNYWSNVAPKQFFAYFGMGTNTVGSTYDLGFAKQFKKFYWGTYFSGNLGPVTTTKTTTAGTTTKTKTTGDSEFSFNNTFGFGNVGLGIDFHYFDDGSSITDNTTDKNETVELAIKAGLKEYKIKKTRIIPYAAINYGIRGNKTVNTVGGTTTTVDSRFWNLGLSAGADIPLGKDKNVEQTATVGLGMTLIKPADSDDKTSNFAIGLPVGYKVVLKATNALSVGFKADADLGMSFGKAGSDTSVFAFAFEPKVAAGLTYATKKNIDLNAGVNFAVPAFTYSKTSVSGYSSGTAAWNGTDGSLSFNSGFAIKPTKNICIDCSYEILAHIFGNNTETGLTEGNYNFWNTVNKVLVHNIGFEVSAKF